MPRRPQVTTITGDLFEIPKPAAQLPGTMDYRRQVSHIASKMLSDAAAAGLDRWQVAALASRLADKDVSKAMLDGYTAESREEFNCPLWLAPVLESVCDSTLFTGWMAGVRGGRFLVGAATIDAEVGRLERERDQTNERLRQLRELQRSHQ